MTITQRNGRVRIVGNDGRSRARDADAAAFEAFVQKTRFDQRGRRRHRGGRRGCASGWPKTVSKSETIDIQHAGRRIKPRSAGQARYVDAIREYDLTFATGPAGCGKTYLAVATAVEALKAGKIRKIVLVRPAVEAGESLGFLPGDLRAKLNPYLRPLLDALGEMINLRSSPRTDGARCHRSHPVGVHARADAQRCVHHFGRSSEYDFGQMKMFLTRMGERSKMVVSGDITQQDLPGGVTSGLKDALRRLSTIQDIGVVKLNVSDIVRHHLVQKIVQAYESSDGATSGRKRRAHSNGSNEDPVDQ